MRALVVRQAAIGQFIVKLRDDRLEVISQRAGFQSTLAAGASAAEIGPATAAGVEIAKLWSAVERSIEAINNARFEPGAPANEGGVMGAGERAA